MFIFILSLVTIATILASWFSYIFFCSTLETKFLGTLRDIKIDTRQLISNSIYRKLMVIALTFLHGIFIVLLYITSGQIKAFLFISFLLFFWVLLCYFHIQKSLLMGMRDPGETPVAYLTDKTFFSKFVYASGILFAASLYVNYGLVAITIALFMYFVLDYLFMKKIKENHDRKLSPFTFKTNIFGLYKQYVRIVGYDRIKWFLFSNRIMAQVYLNFQDYKARLTAAGKRSPTYKDLYDSLVKQAQADIEHLDVNDCVEFAISFSKDVPIGIDEAYAILGNFNSIYLDKQKKTPIKFLVANKILYEVINVIQMDLIEHLQQDMDIVKRRDYIKNKFWPSQFAASLDFIKKIEGISTVR